MTTTEPVQIKKQNWRGFAIEGQNHTLSANWPDRITGPSAWDGKELESQPEKWLYQVTEQDIQDIHQAVQHFNSLNIPLQNISVENFPLKHFDKVIKDHLQDLFHGLGFSLIRGFPITEYERRDQIIVFMGIGAYIGRLKPQNGKGHILGHVKDLTEHSQTKVVYKEDDPTTRIYATRKAQPFHVDGSDVVALLCLSEGSQGGLSSIISSHTVYNRLRQDRPDIVELMKQPWFWDRKNEHGPNEIGYLAAAPLTFFKDHLFTFWGPHFFETVNRFPEIEVEEEKFEAMRYIQELCEREALNMNLQVGDIQFVQNYQILHARSAYVDTYEKTRHLLRLWFTVDQKEVGWELPFGKEEHNYNYEYSKRFSVPLEAE